MSLEAEQGLVFRPYQESDLAFIYNSWGSSYYTGSKAKRHMSPEQFHKIHRPTIDQFFKRPTATVIVASHNSDPDLIIGWIAVEQLEKELAIHYVYIKSIFRRLGLLTALIDKLDQNKPAVFTRMTERIARILAKNTDKYKRFTYLPIT